MTDPYPEYQQDIARAREQAAYAKRHGQTAQLAAFIRLIEYLLGKVLP